MCECAAHVMEGEEIDVGIATVGDTRIAPPAEAAKDRTDRDADFATEAEEDGMLSFIQIKMNWFVIKYFFRCTTCHGNGWVRCRTCHGAGQLKHYIELKVENACLKQNPIESSIRRWNIR